MESDWLILTGKIFVYFFGSLAILLTVLPVFKLSYWIFRIGDFPRLQIAVVCLILLILNPFIFAYDYFLIVAQIILAGCLIYQLFRIIPYTPLYKKQVLRSVNGNGDAKIKILISNVLIENRSAGKLLDRIKEADPDVILLAEVDDWWDKAVESLKNEYPHNLCHPLDNAYGMNFYSRLETKNCELNFVVEDDIPSVESNLILESGDCIKFFGLHPRPPVPTENARSAERDAELIIVGRKIKKENMPTIIAGDFNDVAWSSTTNLFQKISGLLDARIGRGFYNSFHAKIWLLRMPLDHVFQTNHFRLVELKRLESIDSDHFPIFIELSLEKIAEKVQEKPESNGQDEKEADEKVKEAFEC